MSFRIPKVLGSIHRRTNWAFNGIAALTVVAIMILVVGNIVSRRLFSGHGISAVDESAAEMMAIVIFLALAATQMGGGHVKVEVLTQRLAARTQLGLEVFALLAGACFMGLMGWRLGLVSWDWYKTMHRTMGELALPVYPFAFVGVFGCGLLALQYLVDSIQRFVAVLRWKGG